MSNCKCNNNCKCNKRKISVEIVADSIDGRGNRIISAIFQFPRYILAELNTHRILSKNSASSRAIPFKKMLKSVMEDPFIPIAWQKDHSGMQGTEYFTDEIFKPIKLSDYRDNIKMTEILENEWLTARNYAATAAETLNNFGLTKQLCNRLLEPFLWHRVLITGTEWDNFFALRAHPDAEIHIAKLADEALKAFNASTPKLLKPGEWHIPFGENIDNLKLANALMDLGLAPGWSDTYESEVYYDSHPYSFYQNYMVEGINKIAIARCARVSYDNFDGTQDYKKDIELFNRLFARNPIHASPAEHVARCMDDVEYRHWVKTTSILEEENETTSYPELGWCRNFKGFIQYRTLLANDTILNDERLIIK